MATYKLKKKRYSFISGIGSFTGITNMSNAFRAGTTALGAKTGSNVAKGMGNVAAKQATIGLAKMGAIGGTIAAGKTITDKLTGEN